MLDLSYSMWDLVLLTRDGTLAPALGAQSQPLDHQGSPYI